MRIYVITPGYPSKNNPIGATPIVHYFTREWVKMGHKVTVFHLEKQYPLLVRWFSRMFEAKLYSLLGNPVRIKKPIEYVEENEGVKVYHRIIRKSIISKRYYKRDVYKMFEMVKQYCHNNGIPDAFVGHWDNPQLELLSLLKSEYPTVKNSLVLHTINKDLKNFYSKEWGHLIDSIDTLGFRNYSAQEKFKDQYFTPKRTFVAASGISEVFVNNSCEKKFEEEVKSFIYVGALIKRKHPFELLKAVTDVYGNKPYNLTYIGEGNETETILKYFANLKGEGKLEMTGRIPREKVIDYLKQSDVFVMISDHETFGLVYLEAMSMGCITVASVGGGVDGIIKSGVNGFLCKQGDARSLAEVIETIRSLSIEEKIIISRNAVSTALYYSDRNVAKSYLNAIVS